MGIEALYPYIAVAYGTFGLVFGVFLWSKTRKYIFGTKHAIEEQVANAVTDIGARVDEKMAAIVMPDMAPIMAKMTELEESIPDFNGDELEQSILQIKVDLIGQIDAMKAELPDMVGTHIQMAIKGVQAAEGKAIAQYVESLGVEGITEEAKEAAIEKLTLKQKAAYQLMTLKIPKKTRAEHPLSSQVFEQSRGFIAQAIIEHDEMGGNGNVTIDNGGGGSHRPGFHR